MGHVFFLTSQPVNMGAERAGEASRRTYHLLVSIWSLPCSADRRACTSTNGGPEKQMSHEGGVKGYHCPRQEMVQAGLGSFGKALALPASGLEFDPQTPSTVVLTCSGLRS